MSEKSKHKIDASVVICAILCVVLLALCVVGVVFGVRDGVPVVAYADDVLYGEIVYHSNLLPDYNYGFATTLTLDGSYPKQANILTNGVTVYYSLQRAGYGYATISGLVTDGYTQFLVHKSMGSTSTSQRPQLYIIFPVTVDVNTLYTYYCDVYDSYGTVSFGFCNYDFDNNTVTASTSTNVNTASSAPSVVRTSSTEYSYFYILITTLSSVGSESYLTTNYMKLEEGIFYSGREPLSSGDAYNQGYNFGYNDGLNAYDTSRYNLLDTFNKDGFNTANGAFYTQFTYDGRDYDTGVTASWTTVNSSSYSMSRLVPAQSGKYVGIKYVNNLLFGDIVLQFAMSTNPNFPAVFHFVDTVTGDTLIVSSGDTVHFKYIR